MKSWPTQASNSNKSHIHLVCRADSWREPLMGSDNIPTVACSICAIVNVNSTIIPVVFYHSWPLNNVTDDASCCFDSPNNQFLSFFSRKYCPRQSHTSWTSCNPPKDVTLPMISALCGYQSDAVTFPMIVQRPSTASGCPSVLMSKLITCFRTMGYLPSRSFRCMDIGSITDKNWCLGGLGCNGVASCYQVPPTRGPL